MFLYFAIRSWLPKPPSNAIKQLVIFVNIIIKCGQNSILSKKLRKFALSNNSFENFECLNKNLLIHIDFAFESKTRYNFISNDLF